MAAAFSYAQAAKGLSTGPSSSSGAAPSKPSSGSVTPAKDTLASNASTAAVMSWADDAEANETRSEKTPSSQEPRTQPQTAAVKGTAASQASTTSVVSSPDLSVSSASTVTKDDDVSSIPNTSSDSTWENKSQASTSVEKSVDAVDKLPENASEKTSAKSSEKGKRKNAERAPAKPLQEAPIPMVNIWKQRAESAKAKPKSNPAKPAASTTSASQSATPSARQAVSTPAADAGESKEKTSTGEGKPKVREEEKGSQPRKDSRTETGRTVKGRQQEKDTVPAPASLPLPPNRDQESWPTPETALDEDRKKSQDKTEKERKDSSAGKPSGKKEWVNMAITPNVIFNTPLPNAAGARRGGRGAVRGGAQSGGRVGGYTPNGTGNGIDKDASAPASIPNGDQSKRGRPDGAVPEAFSKEKRTASVGSFSSRDKLAIVNGEKSAKAVPSEADVSSRRTSAMPDANGQMPNQNSTYPRQFASRPGKGRRGDFSGQDRRKDGESVSPTKENGVYHERGTSMAMHPEALENGERRAPNLADGPQSHPSKRGSSDRQYATYTNRDRNNRGGARGGRGSHQNGHQYSNGHVPSMKNSTYAGPLSPTAFNGDVNHYFAPPSGRYKGPRSQSVADNMYRMPVPYGGPAPIQTYAPGMYDFPPAQPMSAAPFANYGMDQNVVYGMVSTQMEYYFSLENLLKDMYLRKQMDSQGFVFLNTIAGFNRIKHLTTDLEMIKLVCHQSKNIEVRTGNDRKDRLRLRKGWEQWVLPMAQRDPLAQNDGPEDSYYPPIPQPRGFEPNGGSGYPEMSAASPSNPIAFDNQGLHPAVDGFHPGAPQHLTMQPSESATNGSSVEGVNGSAISNGHPIDTLTKAERRVGRA